MEETINNSVDAPKVTLVEPRGFCAGVVRIVDTVELIVKQFPNRKIFLNHEAVHNKHITQKFLDMGVGIEPDVDKVPEGAVYILSAHGSKPEFVKKAKSKNITVIDATCPLVTKVHLEVNRFANEGYAIFYIGHKGHPEAEAAMSIRPDCMVLVDNLKEAESVSLPAGIKADKLIYLTQTTLFIDDCERIAD
ncbi:MAG: 4-hydroxy-3-methylbut-2-enyl diphosphate reductase, partial [Patescibacteria group bacterium]